MTSFFLLMGSAVCSVGALLLLLTNLFLSVDFFSYCLVYELSLRLLLYSFLGGNLYSSSVSNLLYHFYVCDPYRVFLIV